MNISLAVRIGFCVLVSTIIASGSVSNLHYKFSAGETNAFAVEISVRNENGTETNSGIVILVTTESSTNTAKLSCHANLKPENHQMLHWGGFYNGGFNPGMMQMAFPENCEIILDLNGNELRDAGDYSLPAPLGKLVQSIYEPLPQSMKGSLTAVVWVLDEPFWLGPSDSFLNTRFTGQPFMGYSMNRGLPATLAVSRHTKFKPIESSDNLVKWHKQTVLESLLKTGSTPRLAATCESDFVFDRLGGQMISIETRCEISTQTQTTSRRALISFKCHRLAGDELVAALTPPPAVTPRKLAGAELEKFIADLKSNDQETRQNALRQLNGATIDSPIPELIDLVAGAAMDSDTFSRMVAANFLGTYASTNQVPVLLTLLKNSDWSVRTPVVKALGRLRDPRAIQPLVDAVARNGMSGQEAASALINIGPPAEKIVLTLLDERSVDTRRQACNILQRIGTAASLLPLESLVGDADPSLNQAATDAIREIKARE